MVPGEITRFVSGNVRMVADYTMSIRKCVTVSLRKDECILGYHTESFLPSHSY